MTHTQFTHTCCTRWITKVGAPTTVILTTVFIRTHTARIKTYNHNNTIDNHTIASKMEGVEHVQTTPPTNLMPSVVVVVVVDKIRVVESLIPGAEPFSFPPDYQ